MNDPAMQASPGDCFLGPSYIWMGSVRLSTSTRKCFRSTMGRGDQTHIELYSGSGTRLTLLGHFNRKSISLGFVSFPFFLFFFSFSLTSFLRSSFVPRLAYHYHPICFYIRHFISILLSRYHRLHSKVKASSAPTLGAQIPASRAVSQ